MSERKHPNPMLQPQLPPLLPHPPHPQVDQCLRNIELLMNGWRTQVDQLSVSLPNIRREKMMNSPPTPESLNSLISETDKHLADIQRATHVITHLFTEAILSPPQMHRAFSLLKQREILHGTLNLQRQHLASFVDSSVQPLPLFLCIVKDPFPYVYAHKQQVHPGQLEVAVLPPFGQLSDFQYGQMTAMMVAEARQVMELEPHPLGDHVQDIEPVKGVATFPLTFNFGTRKEIAHIRFSLSVRVSPSSVVNVESDHSQPFVVMTNQKQWENCSGTLLRKLVFDGKTDIPWPRLANSLQQQFLLATRQSMAEPVRGLSCYDMSYVCERFFKTGGNISLKEFERFWNWYGKCLQVLRFQRHISQLWQRGLFYGFMTREDVRAALSIQPPGSFIIRFSESHPGRFGVAYISTDTPPHLKHYLVKPTDTAAAKITLPDFLRDKPQFSHILQLRPDPSGRPHFELREKHVAFGFFYSNRDEGINEEGYDPL